MPCPAHTIGHPNIVVTQLSNVSSSIAPERHHFSNSHSTTALNNDKQESGQLEPGRRISAPSIKTNNEAFELRLWGIVPPAFRPNINDSNEQQTASQNSLERPDASDTVDRSERMQTTPKTNRFFNLFGQQYGTETSPVETASPPSPLHKRRFSDSSPSVNIKRRNRHSQENSEDIVTSPLLLATTDLRERNPFEVDTNQTESDINFIQHLQDSYTRRYTSQQISKAPWGPVPTTPPMTRYRGVSLDPETPPMHSPTPYDKSKWKPLVRSMSGGTEPIANDTENFHGHQTSGLISPNEASGVVNSLHSPIGDHSSELRSFGQGDNRAEQITPTRRTTSDLVFNENTMHPGGANGLKSPTGRFERRLSMSSVLMRTPPSASRSHHQIHYRSLSFSDLDSPSRRTPTKSRRKDDQLHLPSDDPVGNGATGSFLDSPSGNVQWSQSLETPVKNRAGTNDLNRTPTSAVIQRLRGFQPQGTMEDSASAVEGWSSLLETPPRRFIGDRGSNPDPRAFDGILDRLRGNPGLDPVLAEKENVPDTNSQSESFYSACSSIVNEVEYQNNLEQSAPNARNRVIHSGMDILTQRRFSTDTDSTLEFDLKLDDELDMDFMSQGIDVGLTLPSSLVHELEQESLIMDSQDFQSQILLDSQNYAFEQDFDHNHGGPIDLGQTSQPSQLPELGNYMDIGDDPQAGQGRSQPKIIEFAAPPPNIHGTSNQFVSQRTSVEIQHTAKSLATHSQRYGVDSTTENQVQRSPELERVREFTEPPSEDDLANIRFSQLDDAFNTTIEATQRPQKSPGLFPAAPNGFHIDTNEAGWLSTSASMLGGMEFIDSNQTSTTGTSNRSLPTSTSMVGFETASGKKLAPLSKSALARVANMFEDANDSGINADSGYASFNQLSETRNEEASKPIYGFQTAGKKSLPPISDATRKKIAHLFDDEDLGLELGPPSDGYSRASEQSDYHIGMSSKLDANMPPDFGASGGFKTGRGKKLAPVSKDALEKWKKHLTEDEDSERTSSAASNASKILDSLQEPQPQDRPQQEGFIGFASGAGRALAPISKAAQDRALSFLELDNPPSDVPTTHSNTFKQGFNINSRTSGTLNANMPVFVTPSANKLNQKPTISNHMNNLKLKSIRGGSSVSMSSRASNQQGKAKTAFRSPLAFKPPLLKNLSAKSESNKGVGVNNDNLNSPSTEHLTLAKKQVNKRSTLHPNARLGPVEPLAAIHQQPAKSNPEIATYKHLANIQNNGNTPKLRDVFEAPRQRDIDELLNMGVPEDAARMSISSAQSFRFDDWGVENAYQDMISLGAAPNLLSKIWLENHYRLIVWKLACYVRSWPEILLDSSPFWFSPSSVMNQLAYRYEREINRTERPALRKIVEGDDSVAKHMVLCVASISKEYSEETKQEEWKVAVTDGWYILPAALDACLMRALMRGKIKVGSKLHICRAKLNGAENGAAILELSGAGASTSEVSISLQANGTRLARWDTKLGFQRVPMLWTTNISSISTDGGLVPGLDVVVLRKYPVVYLETLEDGVTKIRRTAREEERAVEAHKEQMQKRYQDAIQQVEKEFDVENGESNHLLVQQKIQEKASEIMTSHTMTRNVVPFFLIRVGNYFPSDKNRTRHYHDSNDNRKHCQEAIVTFWHSDHRSYREGYRVRLTSLIAKKPNHDVGSEDIQLVGTRMTTGQEMSTDPEDLLLTDYHPREVTSCIDISNLYQGAEVDIAVIVLAINRVSDFNKVYLVVADSSKHLLLVEHQLPSNPSASPSEPSQQLPSFLKIQSRLLITNARFKFRDHKLGLDIVSTSLSHTNINAILPTQFSGHSSWPVYAQPSLQRLNELCGGTTGSKNEGGAPLELMVKANSILESMRPSL
ncbi:Breast cancer 2, early onset [Entomortierella beljakovae]|nr:Breast cancer 2, early onset [Entomortierella beljakovae]